MRLVDGAALPRRMILIGACALTLLAMSGCGALSPGSVQARRRIEKSLKSFDAVKSVNVKQEYNFELGRS